MVQAGKEREIRTQAAANASGVLFKVVIRNIITIPEEISWKSSNEIAVFPKP